MPIKVVTDSHTFSDNTCIVPSVDDFEGLQTSIRQLKRELTTVKSSISVLKRTVKAMQGKVTGHGDALRELKQNMLEELTDGEWKTIIDREIREATQQLEATMNSLKTAGVSLISEGVAKKMRKSQTVKDAPSRKSTKASSGKKNIVKKK